MSKDFIKCNKGYTGSDRGECCCNCANHYEDFYHCTTEPKPKNAKGCVCSKHKGWICLMKFEDEITPRAHSNWVKHGMCEMWRKK